MINHNRKHNNLHRENQVREGLTRDRSIKLECSLEKQCFVWSQGLEFKFEFTSGFPESFLASMLIGDGISGKVQMPNTLTRGLQ